MTKTKRILHLIHGLTIGGAELDLLHKCRYLVQRYGYQMSVACLLRRGELADQFEALGIQVLGPLMRHRYDLLAGWRLRQLLAQPQWDLIHTHLCAANLISWGVNQTLFWPRKPQLAGEHAMADRWPTWVLGLDQLMVRSGVLLLTPSQAAANSYITRGLSATAVQVLANGIDLTRFQAVDAAPARRRLRQELGLADDEFLIGVVCRLEPVKNLPQFFGVVAALPVKTVVVGSGSQSQQLSELLNAQGWQDRIRLVGSQRNVPAWLAAFDLLVLPSISESFGLVVAEALLMQTPVVATRVGGIPELTGDGAYATLVPPGEPLALQAAIQWVQTHYDQAKAQAVAGQSLIQKKFSVEACGDQLHKYYTDALH